MRKFISPKILFLVPLFFSFLLPMETVDREKLEDLARIQKAEWVDSVMNSLSLREKIGQLFMVAAYSNGNEQHIKDIASLVKNHGIGGLCFFQGGPVRQAQHTNYYQSLAQVPLLISIDAEWGLGMRLDSTISYPRQMLLGAMHDSRLVYAMGADIAKQLKRVGVHINFAPAVDVNNNAANPVIGTRSFGEDKEWVAQNGLAYALGLQDNGVLACAKHFPGHGDTDTDSHYHLPYLNHARERIDSLELYPFRRLIENGVSGVMVSHLEVPVLEKQKGLPATLSYSTITELLKQEMDFKGLVYTDALNMKGIAAGRNHVDINVMALEAGNDVLLFTSEIVASIKQIEKLVKKGKISKELVEDKCRRIIETKYDVGLHSYEPIQIENLVEDVNSPDTEANIHQMVEQAITLLQNEDELIPLVGLDSIRIAYVEIGKGMGSHIEEQLRLYVQIDKFSLSAQPFADQLQELRNSLANYDVVILGYHCLQQNPAKSFNVSPAIVEFTQSLSAKTILALFGTPYALGQFTHPQSYSSIIVSYDNSKFAQNLTAQLIFGGITANGRLPVTAAPNFPVGSGLETKKKIRLAYASPEVVGLNSAHLARIDSIANDAIERYATPGMQVLVAKNGVVFYNKNFGKTSYSQNGTEVTSDILYDIASVTKVASTLPLVMDLYSKGALSLDDKLGDFFVLNDTLGYANLVVRDILLHQSGLHPWIPFFHRTVQPLWPQHETFSSQLSQTHPYYMARRKYLALQTDISDAYYQYNKSDGFPHHVARGLYSIEGIRDTMLSWIAATPIRTQGEYRYSDLGFILLYWAIQEQLQGNPSDYLHNTFFSKLGMYKTLYNPLKRFDLNQIAPTENDAYFRKQVVWGYVHDPAAAMLGGEAGHAGLFSTANDLAKLMQMYLNGGEYGGVRFFPDSTVSHFTSCVNCANGVRRGLGFDKPETNPDKDSPVCESASALSYGHSGFTGTLVWADPAHDLVYIFLSNRIYPDANNSLLTRLNVRTEIQEIVYDAIRCSNGVE